MNLSRTDKCCICKHEKEDVEHILINCSGINQVWEWVECSIKCMDGKAYTVTKQEKIINYKRDEKHSYHNLIQVIIAVARYELWKCRCVYRYDKRTIDIKSTIETIKAKLNAHIKLIKKKLIDTVCIRQRHMDNLMRYLTRKTP